MKRIVFYTSVIATFLAWSVYTSTSYASEVSSTETKTFKMKPGGLVLVDSDDGYITINSWNKDEVEVTIKKRAWGRNKRDAERNLENIRVEIHKRGDNLYIRDITDEHVSIRFGFFDLFRGRTEYGTRVDFEINLPKKMNLDLNTDDGDIQVTDVHGDLNLEVDDGDVFLCDIQSQKIEVNLDDGDLRIENVKPINSNISSIIFVSCDDGEIVVRQSHAETMDFDVDDGGVFLEEVTVKNLNVDLDDSDFESELDVLEDGRIRVWSDDGNIELWLPEKISAHFNLFARSGRIRTNFPVEIERHEGESRAREKIGDGNITVRLETSDGDILLRHR